MLPAWFYIDPNGRILDCHPLFCQLYRKAGRTPIEDCPSVIPNQTIDSNNELPRFWKDIFKGRNELTLVRLFLNKAIQCKEIIETIKASGPVSLNQIVQRLRDKSVAGESDKGLQFYVFDRIDSPGETNNCAQSDYLICGVRLNPIDGLKTKLNHQRAVLRGFARVSLACAFVIRLKFKGTVKKLATPIWEGIQPAIHEHESAIEQAKERTLVDMTRVELASHHSWFRSLGLQRIAITVANGIISNLLEDQESRNELLKLASDFESELGIDEIDNKGQKSVDDLLPLLFRVALAHNRDQFTLCEFLKSLRDEESGIDHEIARIDRDHMQLQIDGLQMGWRACEEFKGRSDPLLDRSIDLDFPSGLEFDLKSPGMATWVIEELIRNALKHGSNGPIKVVVEQVKIRGRREAVQFQVMNSKEFERVPEGVEERCSSCPRTAIYLLEETEERQVLGCAKHSRDYLKSKLSIVSRESPIDRTRLTSRGLPYISYIVRSVWNGKFFPISEMMKSWKDDRMVRIGFTLPTE